jgi:hypothetical protein
MSKRIKVRFNLSRGKHYMQWKITYPTGAVQYCSPTSTQLVMTGCTLKNSRITAEKIFNGQHKVVCAWVLCDSIKVKYSVFNQYDVDGNPRVKYNPRVKPHWVIETRSGDTNADNSHFSELGSVDYKLFITKI